MRASRRRSAALAAVLLLGLAGLTHGVTARTMTFQSRFRTEKGKEWQVHLDHDSGRPYFFDKETGTSTWDDPRTTPNDDAGDDASSRAGGLLGSLFEPGEVKFTGGGLGGKSRRSSKRAAREAEETKRSWFFPGWKKLFPSSRASPPGASDDDYGELDADQRRSAGGWSEPSSARRRRVGTGGAGTKAGHDENTGRMRLDDDDARGDDDDAESNARTFSYPRAPFARGVVAVTLVSSATSVGVLCVSAVARVVDRAGKGGVGYSRRDATFLGETAREIRFAVAKSTRRKRARLESSFAVAQTVLMETFASLAEMRLGRGAVAFAAGARKIEKSAELASLAQFCVLSHHLVESAERVARFLEHRAIAGTEGENNRLSSLASTQTACLPPVTALVAASPTRHTASRRGVRRARARGERGVRADPSRGVHACARAFSSLPSFVTGASSHRLGVHDTALARNGWRRACTRSLSRLGRRGGRACAQVSTGVDRSARAATTRTTRTTRTEPASTATRSPARAPPIAAGAGARKRKTQSRGAPAPGGARAVASAFLAAGGRIQLGRTQSLTARLAPCCLRAARAGRASGRQYESGDGPRGGVLGARGVSRFDSERARARTLRRRRGVRGGIGAAARDGGGEVRRGRARRVDETGVNTCARARRERRGRRGARSRLSSKPEKHGLSHSSSGRLIRRVTFSVNADEMRALVVGTTTRRAW